VPLSAVIITKNAGARLGECLTSLAFCDEVLIVDSGSMDDTLDIARVAGARVIEHAWLGYGPQKRYAVTQALHDWVLCIDADERVSELLRQRIVAEMRAPSARVFAMPRCNRFLGRWLRHGEGYPDWSIRLFHRESAQWSGDPVHETVLTSEPVSRLQGDLLHDSAETLELYLDKQNRYTSLQAVRLHAAGRSASYLHLVVSPIARFLKFYIFRLGFLDGLPGLVHICIGCTNSFNKYAKLIALNQKLES
jgi:glycosyltransferase involved in cell wall biosynthesis